MDNMHYQAIVSSAFSYQHQLPLLHWCWGFQVKLKLDFKCLIAWAQTCWRCYCC